MKIKQKFKKAMSFLLSAIMIMMICFGSDFGTLTVYAIDYSIGESDGFSLDSENNVSATFTITEKLGTGTMQGWLLCLFSEKPSVDASTGKLKNSGSIHPYSYSNCAYYFFSPDTENVTGTHTALWSGTASDEKGSGKTLGEVIKEEDWHIVIGPRYYFTGWGASGIGEGTGGIWENGDYYVGQASEKVGGYLEPPAHTHSLTLVPEKPATCTTAGNKAYYTCSGCDTLFTDANGTNTITAEAVEIAELGHDMSEATCTEASKCQREGCDHTEGTALGHDMSEATCTEASKCQREGCDHTEGTALGHDWTGEWTIIKEATATEDGKKETLCTRGCGEKKEEVIPATGVESVDAPVITIQPENKTAEEGKTTTFSVTATGENLTYQWQIDRNDGKGFVSLNGATSASYTTSTVDMDCNGFKYQCIVSNEGGSVTSDIATLTVTEKPSVHTHSLTQVPAKAATCTEEGNTVYYTCSGCDSLFADANGTTTTTAEAVKVAALEHDWTGEWTIIKEATATEDGKKEILCTRGCGQKKVAIIPATGTADDNSNLEKDAEVEPEAPIDEATLNNSKEELIEADNIFTDEEKIQIENGTNARVWLEITKTDESAIASTDKAKIEQEATQIMGDNLIITYFDADLFKQVGTNEKTPVPEPGIAMKITITIPDELLNNDRTVSREYKIIRLHEGQVDVINGTFDSTTGEFTFKSDKFSTYAIVYKDVPMNENPTPGDDDENTTSAPGNNDVVKSEENKLDEVPKTGESNVALSSFILMLLSGVGVVICSRKKKILNKES